MTVDSQMKQQQGVALIVSLVILVLVTVAGVATMESTGMQLKMANASRDRQEAFEAAETALRFVEENVNDNVDGLGEVESMYFECSGSDCFTDDCTGGRCFQGIWHDGDEPFRCFNVDSAAEFGGTPTVPPATTNPWQTGSGDEYLNVWDDAGLHMSMTVDAYDNPIQYIVEFRCFISEAPEVELEHSVNPSQLYRITARGMSNSGRVEVMLQSTYKRTD